MQNPFNRFKKLPTTKKEALEYWERAYRMFVAKRRPQMACWNRWMNIMDDNTYNQSSMSTGDQPIKVNELKSAIMAILPYIILEPAAINVRAISEKWAGLAFIYEKVAEYINRQYDLDGEFKRVCYDTLLLGNGIVKLGVWDDFMIDSPIWGSGLTEMFNMRRRAKASYTPLYEILPDYRAYRWNEQRVLMNEKAMHIEDIKAQPIYDRKVVNKLSPNLKADDVFSFAYMDEDYDLEDEYVKIQEIHDFVNGEVMVMSSGTDGWLYKGPEPYGIVPFENLIFMHRPRSIWGNSISQSIEQMLLELNETYTYMSQSVAREGILKLLVKLAAFDDEAVQLLESNEDAIIPITTEPGSSLGDTVMPVMMASGAKQYLFETAKNTLEKAIRGISGVTQQERGVHEAGVETKYEASMLKVASEVRNALRQREFSKFAARVLSKLLYIITKSYPAERIVNMAGLEPAYADVLSRVGPFDATQFEVEYGDTALGSRKERVEKMSTLIQLAGPYLNPASVVQILTKALDFDKVEEMLILGNTGILPPLGGQNNQSMQNNAAVAQQAVQSRTVQK